MLRRFEQVSYYIVLMWIAFGFSLYFPLIQFGLVPRSTNGLIGVIFEPFLHVDFKHLVQNSIFLLGFGFLYSLKNIKSLHWQFWFFAIFSGSLTWIFGSNGLHLGASGVVFGFYGYLTMSGYFRAKFFDILISSTLLVVYGTILFGALPIELGVSWQSHLFGLLAGILSAYFDR